MFWLGFLCGVVCCVAAFLVLMAWSVNR